MNHINAIRAALKAVAPVVAIPVEGRVPVCIRARLLKGALKGVNIHSVVLLENGSIKVTGMAAGSVRTSSTFHPMARHEALIAIREWTIREREKRVKVINQGVLSASAQRELKKKRIEAEADEVINQARKEEHRILSAAKAKISPVMIPVDPEIREDILSDYAAFRRQRCARKRGSVIRWRLAKLRAEVKAMTVEKREYEERPCVSRYARRRRVMTGKKTVLRRKTDAIKYAAMLYQIRELERQYKALYPPIWIEREHWPEGGYWDESFIAKRPREQTYRPKENYWGDSEDRYNLQAEARRLREARVNIRALTPAKDEEITQEQVAA
jgi:hypothetical protein